MKTTDEEIQNKIEQGLFGGNSDEHAYQHVFTLLKKDPEFNLPIQFADRLVSILEKKEERRDYYWLAVGILLSVISVIITIALLIKHWSINAFPFLSSNVGLVVFGVIFVALLHLIDKKIVRKQLESHQH